jgi:hypothetical protein
MPDIVCLLGPMLSDPTLTKVRKYLKNIADSASHKGMGNVYFVEMSQQTGSLGLGIDYHPTVAQHKKNGMELTEYIKSLKSWKINPLVLNANVDGIKHIQLEFNTPVHDTLNTFSGFTVNGDDTQYTISNIYSDTTNSKIVYIILQQSMHVGEKISLSYTPGTLESIDSVPVTAINSLPVQNNLTDTKITRGTTNADGTIVTMICNKNIKENSSIDGLTLTDSRGILAIDSFSIVKTQLTLYLEDIITKADSVFASYSGTGLYGMDDIPLNTFSKLVIKNISKYTGISMPMQNSLNIYPNPNHTGVFYYSIDKSMFSKKAAIEIIGSNGIIIEKQMLTATDGQLDLNGKISKGVYFFRITLGDSVIRKTVIVE